MKPIWILQSTWNRGRAGLSPLVRITTVPAPPPQAGLNYPEIYNDSLLFPFVVTLKFCHSYCRSDNVNCNISFARNACDYFVTFYKGEQQIELLQETESEVKDLSPVLFDDSMNSSSCLPASDRVGVAGGAFEVFGMSIEEAVIEMRFRIEQKTMLTASAGQ